jgi:AGCS family alanine or glycine:cation symporter
MEAFAQFLGDLNGYLWGNVLVYVLLGAGLYFTVRTGAIQIRLFGQGVREMVSGLRHRKPGDISPFQAFATGMASRVGVGNIAGVAIAISLGGPGAVFWMWVTALAGMASSVIECTLAQLYKERQPDGTYRGGPAFYIRRGLGNGPLAAIFAFSLVLAFGFAFNAIQSNTIAGICAQTYGWTPWAVGLVLVLMTAPIIAGGVRSVGVVAEFMVPVMAGLYLLITFFVLVKNWSEVPAVLVLIVKSAFGFGPAAAGFAGYTLAQGMTMGVRRSLFSNEAGMGSAPNAAATAETDHPATQGFLQMFGVFIDTIVVCSCTAFLILISDVFVPGQKVEGVTLTQNALSSQIGGWSSHLLAVMIFFFAFSSLIGNYAYAEGNVTFLKKGRAALIVFRMLVLGMVFLGAVAKVEFVWQFGDLSQALMVGINMVAILGLSGTALAVLRDFEKQRRTGAARPVFRRVNLPGVQGLLAEDVWK